MTINIPQANSPDSDFESLWLNCINKIGSGSSRDVYEIPELNKVLKVSTIQSNAPNWTEIIIYQYKKESGELAEIFSWSYSGKFIVMEKLTPLIKDDNMDKFVYPEYLTDRKYTNCGYDSSNKIKVLDYALLKFPQTTISSQFV